MGSDRGGDDPAVRCAARRGCPQRLLPPVRRVQSLCSCTVLHPLLQSPFVSWRRRKRSWLIPSHLHINPPLKVQVLYLVHTFCAHYEFDFGFHYRL